MGEILLKDKEIAVPGEVLAKGMDYIPAGGTFRENEDIIANQLGMVSINGRLVKLVPLTGIYVPKANDIVIGKVVDVTFSSWLLDINSPNLAMLSIRDATEYIERNADLTQYYDYGDIVAAKVTKVTRNKAIDLSTKGPGLRKLNEGQIIEVTPSKVPRIIGKQASMITMIKDATDCKIIVGQNGRIWIHGVDPDKEIVATAAIMKIEHESHTEGLTDRIKEFLDKELKK